MLQRLRDLILEPFMDKKERAIKRAHDPMRLNQTRRSAIETLIKYGEQGDREAIRALLRCFHLVITRDQHEDYDDEKEKHWILQELVRIGKINKDNERVVVEELVNELKTPPFYGPRRTDGIVRLLSLLEELVPTSKAVAILKEVLACYSPLELERSSDRKIELIAFLAKKEMFTEEAWEALLPYLEDVDETVRFRTVETLLPIDDDDVKAKGELLSKLEEKVKIPLLELLLKEESERIKKRIADGFIKLNWSIKSFEKRKQVEAVLASDYKVDKKGIITLKPKR